MNKRVLSILILGLGLSANAQINYTDITDVTLTSANATTRISYDVDFNGDGINDTYLFALDTSITVLGQTAEVTLVSSEFYGTNEMVGELTTPIGSELLKLSVVNFGETISVSSAFINSSTASGSTLYPGAVIASDAGSFGTSGYFANTTNKYIGVKFDINSAFHYGWIQIDVIGNGEEIKIKSFAYEETAGLSINAGDTGVVNVTENELKNSNVYFSNSKIHIKGITGAYNLNIYNLLGEKILQKSAINTSTIATNLSTDAVYLIQISKDSNTITKKLFLN